MPTNYWLKFGNTPLGYNGRALKSTYAAQGSLSVSCDVSVIGPWFDPEKQFGCTVSFGAVVPYTLDGVPQTPAASTRLLLVKGQAATLGDIPAGISYSIAEDPISPEDQALGYSNGTVTGATGTITDGATSLSVVNFGYMEPGIASLPEKTIRFEFTNSSYDPTTSFIPAGNIYRWTRVSASPNRWDCYCQGRVWRERFSATSDQNAHFAGQSTGDIHVLGANLSGVTNCAELFAWEDRFTSIEGLFNTSGVTTAYRMFYACDYLSFVAAFDTRNVTNMSEMFGSCSLALTSAPMLPTGKVTDMHSMFSSCMALVDVPRYDTKNVTDMSGMFADCRSLKRVPQFNTSKVTNISAMFHGCWLLEAAPSFTSGTVTSMGTLFYGCTSLTAIPAINVANVRFVPRAFYNCRAIPSGILAMYQALNSTGKVDSASHAQTFYNCGIDTPTGAAELAQIPSDWK